VTSPSGAAIRDMLRVIGRRFGELHIVLAPCRVQGDGAAEEIAAGIHDLNALGDVDVIIVGRGGGSLEDLWAFNEEVVARAIAGSKVPIISAVGHEVDVTIADFVADLRAPTPSAAAELVVREKQALVETVADMRDRLHRAMGRRLEHERRRMDGLAGRRVLTDPARPLRDLHRRVDDARVRFHRAMDALLRQATHRFELAAAGLRSGSPRARLTRDRHRFEHLETRLQGDAARALAHGRHRLAVAAGRLDSLSPLGVLARGYSLALTRDGGVVRSVAQVDVGDEVEVLLHEGRLDCRVTATREHDDRPQV
jgi:exodeoxyribonuclease VII large subunit